jgi:geranylgeranyl diphosphate synthase type I
MNAVELDIGALLATIRQQAVALAGIAWPELGEVVEASLPQPLPPFALLPLCTGLARGGKPDALTPVAAAVVVAVLALRIVDDCADYDNPHALFHRTGIGRAVNAASALAMAALHGLLAIPFPAGETLLVQEQYIHSFLRVCAGQDREMVQPPQSLDDYCAIVEAKTVAAFEFAAWVGAASVTSDETLLMCCQSCGSHLGWMIQMLDDIEALWFPNGPSDLALGKLTFPVLYGLTLDHPAVSALATLCNAASYDELRICARLDEMEVRRHLMGHALDHRDEALAALGEPLDPTGRMLLEHWLNWVYRDGARLLGTPYEPEF